MRATPHPFSWRLGHMLVGLGTRRRDRSTQAGRAADRRKGNRVCLTRRRAIQDLWPTGQRGGSPATGRRQHQKLAPEQDKTDSGCQTDDRGGRSNRHDSSRERCQRCQLMPSRSMLGERSPERSLVRSPAAGGQSGTRYTGLFALQVSMPLRYRDAVPDGGRRSLSLFAAVHQRRVPVELFQCQLDCSATAIAGSTAGKGRPGSSKQGRPYLRNARRRQEGPGTDGYDHSRPGPGKVGRCARNSSCSTGSACPSSHPTAGATCTGIQSSAGLSSRLTLSLSHNSIQLTAQQKECLRLFMIRAQTPVGRL
jgi:hypothetical protein